MNFFNKKYILIWIIALFFVLTIVGLIARNAEDRSFTVVKEEEPLAYAIGDEVQAEAAIIYDVLTGQVIAEKNIHRPLPIASITKLITAATVLEYIHEEDISEITDEERSIFANTPVTVGDRWLSEDLLHYSLITSSNRGIHAVSRTVEEKTGKDILLLVKDFIQQEKLVQTHVVDVTGLDAHESLSGSESSAYDLALIATTLVKDHQELAAATSQAKENFYTISGKRYTANNTNTLISKLSYETLLSKTGYTDIAGGTLVMVVEILPNRPIAMTVLNSTRAGRFTDMQKLFDILESIISYSQSQKTSTDEVTGEIETFIIPEQQ